LQLDHKKRPCQDNQPPALLIKQHGINLNIEILNIVAMLHVVCKNNHPFFSTSKKSTWRNSFAQSIPGNVGTLNTVKAIFWMGRLTCPLGPGVVAKKRNALSHPAFCTATLVTSALASLHATHQLFQPTSRRRLLTTEAAFVRSLQYYLVTSYKPIAVWTPFDEPNFSAVNSGRISVHSILRVPQSNHTWAGSLK
jgi:hypothetical protein